MNARSAALGMVTADRRVIFQNIPHLAFQAGFLAVKREVRR